ncbi:MAG TPA: hypothetical protein VLT81_07905 [Chondromyces sp.]|jgi:hypothetical protein|nr:hypothetical protein [Chondromyces sp.]
MSLQRQTYLVIGLLVELGLALGVWVSAWWLLLPALLALGMITAALSGICTMTRVLGALPFNPSSSGDIRSAP